MDISRGALRRRACGSHIENALNSLHCAWEVPARQLEPRTSASEGLQSSALSLSLGALCRGLRLRMRLSHYTTRPASAACSAKREPEENFASFGRVVIDFEHWRATSAALCAKRESEENFGFEGSRHAILSTSGSGCEAAGDGRRCGCEASRAPKMRMRGLPGRRDAEAGG